MVLRLLWIILGLLSGHSIRATIYIMANGKDSVRVVKLRVVLYRFNLGISPSIYTHKRTYMHTRKTLQPSAGGTEYN